MICPRHGSGDRITVEFGNGLAVAAYHTYGLGIVFAQLNEGGLAQEVAAEEHPVADFVLF